MTNYRIIVIDPFRLCVEERHIEANTDGSASGEINKLIGGNLEFGFWIPIPGADPDICYVNEDGRRLFGDNTPRFMLSGLGHDEYRGVGVITGTDGEGATQSARVDMNEIMHRLVWSIPTLTFPVANDDTKG